MTEFSKEKINQLISVLNIPLHKVNFIVTCHISTGNTATLAVFNEHSDIRYRVFFYSDDSDEIFEKKLRQFKAFVNKHAQNRVFGTKIEGFQYD